MTENSKKIDDGGYLWQMARRLLFLFDAEMVHHTALQSLQLGSQFHLRPRPVDGAARLAREFWGIIFPNPIGLAAGFDKNGECLMAWQQLGFGHVEVGTVTAFAQQGNPRPRLFRLPQDRALMNRLGFNNSGADEVACNVARQRRDPGLTIPIGINIGKSKIVSLDDAPKDYLTSFVTLADLADYIVINVSSPNTLGLRDLQAPQALSQLLDVLCSENQRRQTPKPLLIKLAPDLLIEDAIRCCEVAIHFNLSGVVVSNTTTAREGLVGKIPAGSGGISGAPLFAKSTALLTELHQEFASKLRFVGVGGVMSGQSAKAKLTAGADLLQVYTGFVYGGPGFVRRLLHFIVEESSF